MVIKMEHFVAIAISAGKGFYCGHAVNNYNADFF